MGSVLAITDDAGTKLEQRHFDAWGNLTHLKIGAQATITDKNQIRDYLSAGNLVVDRGYTSHEHFAEVGLIHMNGRLYDPLLRRFLNADENIQDPHNTQNYNKYGYVMNNPLLYNDPSGEFLFIPLMVASWIVANAAVIGTAALIGAAIGAGMYFVQSMITGNFSWGGFAKSIMMGAVTGAVSGGLGQVFSTTGFWASVGNGALAGAGSGGITSIINGTNLFEGLLKGAVVGGAIGGISYGIDRMVKAGNLTKGNHEYRTSDSPVNNMSNATGDVKYSYGTVHEFQDSYGGLDNYGVDNIYLQTPEGYGVAQDGLFFKKTGWEKFWGIERTVTKGNILGVTTPSNNIYLSKGTFVSKAKFIDTITHETGHVVLQNSKFALLANTATKNMDNFSGSLDNLGHVSIRKMSVELFNKNPWLKLPWRIPAYFFDNSNPELDKLLLPLIKSFKY